MTAWILPLIGFGVGFLQKFSLFSQDVHISALDIIIFLLTLLALPLNPKKYQGLVVPIVVFFTVGLVSLIFALPSYGWQAVFVGSMYLARWTVYSLFFASIIQLIKPQQI